MGAAAVAGGKVGAVIGTAVGTAAGGVGAAPGAAAGTAIGAGTAALIAAGVTAISGEAEYFAEQAAEDAEAYNDKTQSTVEGIARALASGEIYDTGSGYKMAQGISEADLYAKYGIEAEGLDKFYKCFKDAEPELREFGKGLNETTA
jgi:hypothetical protein